MSDEGKRTEAMEEDEEREVVASVAEAMMNALHAAKEALGPGTAGVVLVVVTPGDGGRVLGITDDAEAVAFAREWCESVIGPVE
jgi:hypothetical protein